MGSWLESGQHSKIWAPKIHHEIFGWANLVPKESQILGVLLEVPGPNSIHLLKAQLF